MPKIKAKYSGRPPEIDWLWAAVLERQRVFGLSLCEMAELAGITYDLMRRYINKSPWDWDREARERICQALGLKILIEPRAMGEVKVQI